MWYQSQKFLLYKVSTRCNNTAEGAKSYRGHIWHISIWWSLFSRRSQPQRHHFNLLNLCSFLSLTRKHFSLYCFNRTTNNIVTFSCFSVIVFLSAAIIHTTTLDYVINPWIVSFMLTPHQRMDGPSLLWVDKQLCSSLSSNMEPISPLSLSSGFFLLCFVMLHSVCIWEPNWFSSGCKNNSAGELQ